MVRLKTSARVFAAAPAMDCTACSAPSMNWSRPMARKHSTPFVMRWSTPALVEAAIACRAYERLEERGHLDAMLARYGTLRQYLPAFFALPFQAAAGSETLPSVPSKPALRPGCRHSWRADD